MTNFARILDLGEAERLIRGVDPNGTECDVGGILTTGAVVADYLADFDEE